MEPILFLLLSLLPLALAPPLADVTRRSPPAHAAMDAFVATTVGGLALLHILPHAYRLAGGMALLAALAGFLVPLALHHGIHRWEERALPGLAAIVLLGLALHAVVDGIALVGAGAGHHRPPAGDHLHLPPAGAPPLALAVVLHRLPVALVIWWFAAPLWGRWRAGALLAAIGGATIAGFAVGERLWTTLSSPQLGVGQAAIAGMLFHVLLRHPGAETPTASSPAARVASGAGAVAGVAVVLALAVPEHPLGGVLAGALSSPATFLQLFLASAPPLLAAYAGAGLLFAIGHERWRRARDGAVAAALPVVQLPALALALGLLGPWLTGLRVAVVLAVTLLVGRWTTAAGAAPADDAGLRRGFATAVDDTLPWIMLGFGVAALLEPLTGLGWLQERPAWQQTVLLAALGVPLSFAALGAIPIAALLLHKGLDAGPVAAFLIASAVALDHRRLAPGWRGRRSRILATALLLIAVAAGLLLPPSPAPDALPLHQAAAEGAPIPSALAGLALLALFLAALARRGFRGLFALTAGGRHHP